MQLNIIAACCRAIVNLPWVDIAATLNTLATGNRSDAYALAQRFPRIKESKELQAPVIPIEDYPTRTYNLT